MIWWQHWHKKEAVNMLVNTISFFRAFVATSLANNEAVTCPSLSQQ